MDENDEHYSVKRLEAYKGLGRTEEFLDVIMCTLISLVEGTEVRQDDLEFLKEYARIKEIYPKTPPIKGGQRTTLVTGETNEQNTTLD